MLPHEHERLPFAVTSLERKFIMTPMRGGLRLAGTVEFAGLERPANMQRAWQLHRLSKGLFRQDLNAQDATPWIGLPALPAGRRCRSSDRVADGKVLLAFGHQHLGLTQAAVTAELIAQLASTRRRRRRVCRSWRGIGWRGSETYDENQHSVIMTRHTKNPTTSTLLDQPLFLRRPVAEIRAITLAEMTRRNKPARHQHLHLRQLSVLQQPARLGHPQFHVIALRRGAQLFLEQPFELARERPA